MAKGQLYVKIDQVHWSYSFVWLKIDSFHSSAITDEIRLLTDAAPLENTAEQPGLPWLKRLCRSNND